jgi:hypothetical protein
MLTRNEHLERSDCLIREVQAALDGSELVCAVGSVARDKGMALALGEAKVRPLMSEEITRLVSLGNTCEDWSRVRVADGFDWRRVRNSDFHGDVVLGRFGSRIRAADGIEVTTGIQNSTVVGCVIGHNALVRDVKLLANYVVGEEALLWDCGSIICEGETTFGNGLPLRLGIETGGRDVPSYAEITVAVADALTRGPTRRLALARCEKLIGDHLNRILSASGIIERGATIRRTGRVRNTYVGRNAHVEEATLIDESTLLGNAEEPVKVLSGAVVTRSLLQWGARVDTLAIVDRSVLTEHSHVEKSAKVTESILGPNTGIASGEVTASLVGPLVGFHHQALLIAALWPEGKGNVGAGASVGCNHTSRAPDQEFWCAEGLFIGLNVKVMYPSDFSGSPYSILACGITMPSQKLAFPFSLVTTPSTSWDGIPQIYNEIVPAWLLTDNLFALKRNQMKFKTRSHGRRQPLELEVFRPETVDLMKDACRRMEAVREVRDIYTDRDIAGLGKNYLTEANRQQALAAYRFYTHYYALLGLLEQAEATLDSQRPVEVQRLLTTSASNPRWEHQRRILCDELGFKTIVTPLGELEGMLEVVARDVERSKKKDDLRGRKIISDYAEVGVPADQDPLVQQTWKETRQLQVRLRNVLLRAETLLAVLPGPQPGRAAANYASASA